MSAAAILALIQAGELAVPSIIAAFEKFKQSGGTTMTLQELIDDAHKNNADTIAAAKAELGL
jgi:hypothetical protein